MSARRLIIAMPKGGSGKTATAVTFAWGLHRAGRRVLLVDLDPQGNATGALKVNAAPGTYGVLDFLLRPDTAFEPHPSVPGLDVVPACPWAVGVDLEVQRANQLTGPIAVREALDRVLTGTTTSSATAPRASARSRTTLLPRARSSRRSRRRGSPCPSCRSSRK